MILQSWRIDIWCRNCSSHATAESLPTLQLWVKLCTSSIWLRLFLHWLNNVTIPEAQVVQDCTAGDDLDGKSWVHFMGLKKNRSPPGLHDAKGSFDD